MTPEELPFGVYEHYKGETYEVISVAQHSETLEKMVVYKHNLGYMAKVVP